MMPLLLLLFSLLRHSASFQPFYPPGEESNGDTRTSLSIALLMSFGGAFNSSGSVPGVQVALDLINNDTSLLPGYKLGYQLMDSQCNHSTALKSFFQQVLYGIPKVGLMGSGCSLATEPTADISHFYNLTQVSCASSSAELADRVRFRSYFQMLPTEIDLAGGFVSVCVKNGWRHLSIISQNENIFTNTINRLKELLPDYGITFNIVSFNSDAGPLSLGNELFEERARIFFLAMYAPMARAVLCKAYQERRVYPRYTYLTYGWYTSQWITVTDDIPCSESDLSSIIQYSLSVTQYPDAANKSTITNAGITHNDFTRLYNEKRKELGYSYLINAEQCFDGMWSIAFALNQTINELNSNTTLNRLAAEAEGLDTFKMENFTYHNGIVKQIMFKYLSRTNFTGVTGPVSFASDGIRTVNRLRVLQYRSGFLQEIGAVTVTQNSLQFNYYYNETDSTVWPSGVPYDGVANNVTVSVSLPITILYSLLAGCGIGFTGVCLVFNIIFRKNKFIRLTSPKLNYFIIAGAAFMYGSVVVYTIPDESELGSNILCNLKPRIFSLSYSLCFGTILAKMWRVYYIFTNPNIKKKSGIKDWHLSIFVLVVMIIDILLITIPTAFEGVRNTAKLIPRKENPSDEEGSLGYRTEYYTYICESRGRDIWLGVLYGFKGVLQVAALFLAFGTRRVKVKGLNDSKFIAAIIYITSVVLAVKIVAAITLNEYVDVFSALFATCILITATTTLGLIFIPQMIGLYRDPTGANIFRVNETTNSQPTSVTAAENFKKMSGAGGAELSIENDPFLSDKEKINMLNQKIKDLEKNANKDTIETSVNSCESQK